MKKIKSLILAASVLLSLFVPVTVNAGNTKFGIADDGWIGYISNGSGKPEDLEAVAEAIEVAGFKYVSSEHDKIPSTYVTLESEDDIKYMNLLIEHLEDNDDVTEVYHNWENCD